MLKPQQTQALNLLLQGRTQSAVAAELGISRTTLNSWLKLAEFQTQLTEGQMELWHAALNRAIASTEDAIQTLATICRDPAAKPSDRIAAASRLLDLAMKGVVQINLERRLTALEDRLNDRHLRAV